MCGTYTRENLDFDKDVLGILEIKGLNKYPWSPWWVTRHPFTLRAEDLDEIKESYARLLKPCR